MGEYFSSFFLSAEQSRRRERSGDGMERREAARNPRRQLHLPSSNSLAVKNSRPNGHCNPAHLPETRTKSCSTFFGRDARKSRHCGQLRTTPACLYVHEYTYVLRRPLSTVCLLPFFRIVLAVAQTKQKPTRTRSQMDNDGDDDESEMRMFPPSVRFAEGRREGGSDGDLRRRSAGGRPASRPAARGIHLHR